MPEEPDDPAQPLPPDDATELMTPPTGGAPILPASAVPLREVIGDFEVIAKLGAGGMGAVYRARQISLGRLVALKVLPAQFIEDAESVSRFQREARVAANLTHANLVRVFSAGAADGMHYIAMELIEGEDLGRRLKREGRMPAPEALRICAEVARGLEYAWRTAHLIHRDIKPANIFLAADGAVKVGDLGLAKSTLGNTTGLTQSGTMMGTPHYISPEQALAEREVDFRSDIYSLGCTLYHMLTGEVPYAGTDAITIIRKHLDAPLPAILKVWPQCPIPLARLVGKMLKKGRNERQASYTELTTQIESVWAQIDPLRFQAEADTAPLELDPNLTVIDNPLTPRSTRAITTPPAPLPKSKATLYGGIAAGVVVLGIVAFLIWPKEEKLTTAQLYAKEHAAELRPSPVPAATPSSAVAVGKDATTVWQPLFTEAEWRATGKTHEFKDGLVRVWGAFRKALPSRDGTLRIRAQFREGQGVPLLVARDSAEIGHYKFLLGSSFKDVVLIDFNRATQKQAKLGQASLPVPVQPGKTFTMEFRVQGNQLTGLLDGAVVVEGRDDRIAVPGEWGIDPQGKDAWLESMEFQPLDAPGGASAPPPAEPWQDVLRDPAKLVLSGGAERTPEGVRFTHHGSAVCLPSQGPKHDGAVRMRATFGGVRPKLQCRHTDAGNYYLYVVDETRILLSRWDNAAKSSTPLGEYPLREPLQRGQDYELELRVVGQTLTAKFQGEVLGTVTDGTFPAGSSLVGASDDTGAPVLIKSLEILDLDAPGGASTPPALEAGAIRLWDAPDKLPSGPGVSWEDGAMRLDGGYQRAMSPPSRDAILRATVRLAPEAHSIDLRLRYSGKPGADQYYSLYLPRGERIISLNSRGVGGSDTQRLQRWPLPKDADLAGWMRLELRAIGDELSVYFNGQLLGTVHDASITEPGGVMINPGGPTFYRDVVYVPLDPTTPAAATKEAPFVNGLGMKFVPVPTTGGPTGGQRVLFSIWETRVQDYEVFAKKEGKEMGWPKPDFEQGPTHPAVMVSWDDAQAFCTWLTERERKAGKLGTNERYRLPSDHEWSCAVGIGDQEDPAKTPAQKNQQLSGVFPWGAVWPPSAGVGNFSGEEARGHEAAAGQLTLAGYRDAFPFTSPAGSFAPNRLGLFDLAGNVSEWCDDRFDPNHEDRVLRGSCLSHQSAVHLSSACRYHTVPPSRHNANGFRVVLVPAP
jgi:serine/threonine protein kinase